jgi:8-oxo-dGTP pyrophosphatase MutT (NUDIX family)
VTVDPVVWRNSRAKKRMGAGAVIRDERGRVLLVEPRYKRTWEVPGGSVEADESPRAACARELREELGLTIAIGRLLCLEWQGSEPERSESLMFLYDGGVHTDPSDIALADDELASYRFVEAEQLEVYLIERLARRVRAALGALAEEVFVELENGTAVT